MQAIYAKQSERQTVLSKIASANIAHSLLAILFVGIVLIMSGILVEFNYQQELLNLGGNAFDNYQVALHSKAINSAFEYIVTGMKLELPSTGGNLQAYGLALCLMLAPLVVGSLYVLRMAGYKPRLASWEIAAA